jgi:hypothetical protein
MARVPSPRSYGEKVAEGRVRGSTNLQTLALPLTPALSPNRSRLLATSIIEGAHVGNSRHAIGARGRQRSALHRK